jgi:hypothetical protein
LAENLVSFIFYLLSLIFNLSPLTSQEENEMKPKLVFTALAGLMICSIFSTSQGADKFYYGGCHVQALYPKCPELRDSLRFNMVFAVDLNQDNIHYPANAGLQAVAEQSDTRSPTYWSVLSHYTLWEAEGLQGSYVNLLYNGGTLVNDDSASGGKAMKFSGSGLPRLIQWGPSYYQELGDTLHPIEYTAEFRLKFRYSLYQPRGAMSGQPPTPVCSIMVVETLRDTILKATTLYKNQFPNGGGYQPFLLSYTLPYDTVYKSNNSIEFQIYWFAIPEAEEFRIDYVKVYDDNGRRLMNGEKDSDIIAYVSQAWVHTTIPATGETVVYRWYLRDQPPSVDCFAPYAYIDNLLRQVSTERVGMQASNRILKPRKSLMLSQNKN